MTEARDVREKMEDELREQHVVETGDISVLLKLRKHSLVNICEALGLPTDGVLEEIRALLLKHFTSEKPVIEMGLCIKSKCG